jgi:hypothetical protein
MSTELHSRRGSIIILMLLLLPILVLFAGFAVDIAYVERCRTELRSATDLAAKSAAFDLCKNSNLKSARDKAREIAAANLVGGKPLTLASTDVEFGKATRQSDGSYLFTATGSPFNAVKVIGRRTDASSDGPIHSYFGSFYGHAKYEPQYESFSAFVDVDICLVLDRSGSMKLPVVDGDPYDSNYHDLPPAGNSRWVALDAAVRSFLNVMRNSGAEEKLALVTFASDVTTDQDLAFDMTQIEAELDERLTSVWTGYTDIHGGIVRGNKILTGSGARATALQVLVVLTDGNYTESDPVPAASNAASDDITIHTITFGNAADQTTMQKIASEGNGSHYHADSAADLEAVFQELAASLTVLID